MKRIQKQAIEHYDRMIEWARTQPTGDKPSSDLMGELFKEGYGAYDCPYCKKYQVDCILCKLTGKYPEATYCCNGLYSKMCKSKTWRQWIIRAKKVREYIRENG